MRLDNCLNILVTVNSINDEPVELAPLGRETDPHLKINCLQTIEGARHM